MYDSVRTYQDAMLIHCETSPESRAGRNDKHPLRKGIDTQAEETVPRITEQREGLTEVLYSIELH